MKYLFSKIEIMNYMNLFFIEIIYYFYIISNNKNIKLKSYSLDYYFYISYYL